MRCHLRGRGLARSIAFVSVVVGLAAFCCHARGAQPPDPAAAPKAEPKAAPVPKAPAKPAPAAKAGPASPAPTAAPTEGQKYVVYPVDEDQKNKQTEVTTRLLKATSLVAGEQAVFDAYYLTYILARWSEPENSALLTGFRKQLGNHLKTAKSAAVHDHLNTLTLDFMRKMAGECYPAARVNAVLMIGELNAAEPARPADSPVPLPAALPALISTLEDKQQLDAVKVAAAVGILRHLQLGAVKSPEDRKAVGDAALAWAGSQRPPGRSPDGHAWMRKLAAEILGELRAAGDNGVVATTLAGMAGEATTPFYARCSAAEALGKLDYQGAAGLDASKLAASLGRLAVDACAAEAKTQAEAEAKPRAPAVPEGAFPGAVPPGGPGGPVVPGSGAKRGPGAGGPVVPGAGARGTSGSGARGGSGAGARGAPGLPLPDAGGAFGPQPVAKPQPPIPLVSRNRLKYRVYVASFGLGGTKENPAGIDSLAKGTAHEKFVTGLQQQLRAILDLIEANRTDDDEKLKDLMKKLTPEADKLRALLAKPPA